MTIRDIGAVEFERSPEERGKRTVRELQATPVVSCPQDMAVEEALHLMESQKSTRLVVLDGERRPVGLLTKEDLLRSTG